MNLMMLLVAILICIAIFAAIRLLAKYARVAIDPDLTIIIAVIVVIIVLGYLFHIAF